MNDTHLIQTFRALDKSERRSLRKWVNSPFFNQREDVVRLFEYLYKNVPIGADPVETGQLDKKTAYPQVFPERAQTYVDADMRYAMSFLHQTLKQFLAYAQWAEDRFETGRYLCRSLQHRHLDQVFEKEYAALNTGIADAPLRSVDYFFQQYHLHLEGWEVIRRARRSDSDMLLKAGAARDAFFASETLRMACAVLAQPGNHDPKAESVYLPATLTAMESGAFQQHPAVMAYYHCYWILSDKSGAAEPHFQLLSEIIREHWTIFPPNEIRDLYIGAINYCIRRLNSGARNYIREALNLYRSGLDRKVILEDGFLNRYTYNNIMLLALGVDEWDWAFNFLETYKAMLPPRERDNAWRYNLGTYYFRKKEYDKAQDILRKVEFRDTFYNLDARRMLVRIYMDTNEMAALDSLLDSFTIYLQRKRSTLGYHKELNHNFVRFVKSMLNLRTNDTEAREKLREKIASAQYVAEREWLLGKL
jgi:hypothetical protein